MATLIGRIDKKIYISDDGGYGIYSLKHGRERSTICVMGNQPKVIKSSDYKLIGNWNTVSKYGKRFVVFEFSKVGKVTIQKKPLRQFA